MRSPIFQSCQSLVRAVPAKPPCPHSYIYRSQILGAGKTFVPSVLKMLRSGRRVLGLGLGQGSSAGGGGRGAFAINRLYHERVVDHYNNPRNVGSFDKNDPTVGTGLVGAPACGDVMKLQIKIDNQSGKIVDACFKTFGCGSAIASSSVVTEWVKGKPMEEVLSIKNTEIAKHLSLPPVKLHCSMLAEDAIKAAVKDYEAKRAKLGANAEASTMERAAHA